MRSPQAAMSRRERRLAMSTPMQLHAAPVAGGQGPTNRALSAVVAGAEALTQDLTRFFTLLEEWECESALKSHASAEWWLKAHRIFGHTRPASPRGACLKFSI